MVPAAIPLLLSICHRRLLLDANVDLRQSFIPAARDFCRVGLRHFLVTLRGHQLEAQESLLKLQFRVLFSGAAMEEPDFIMNSSHSPGERWVSFVSLFYFVFFLGGGGPLILFESAQIYVFSSI